MAEIVIGRVGKNLLGYVNVRCDRKTVFGNPFVMQTESQRDSVIQMYRAHMRMRLAQGADQELIKAMAALLEHYVNGYSINLQCWCSPKACHCEVIRDELLSIAKAHARVE